MISVSNAFRAALNDDQRNYLLYADITLKNGRTLNLRNEHFWNGGFSINTAVSSDSSFDIGAAIIGKASLILNNIYGDFDGYNFADSDVVLYVGLNLNGTIEKLRKGTFIVDEATYNGSLITLSCLDNLLLCL